MLRHQTNLEQIPSNHSNPCMYVNYQILDFQNEILVAQGSKRRKTKAVCSFLPDFTRKVYLAIREKALDEPLEQTENL